MELALTAQTFALIIALGTGTSVLVCNVRRGINQAFAAFCLVQAAWMICIMVLTVTPSEPLAYGFLIAASIAAAGMPVTFNAVRLAILYPTYNLLRLASPNRIWLLAYAGITVLCFTPVFLQSVIMPPVPNPRHAIIEPVYGIGFAIYAAYHLISFIVLIVLTARNVLTLRGLARNEMQILLLGLFACTFVGCALGLIPPLVFGTSAGSPWTPACIMLVNLFVAYGIATQRIMGVHAAIRRGAAYGLLGLYFLAIFGMCFYAFDHLLPHLGIHGHVWPDLVTTIATAWIFYRSSRSVSSFTNRLFIRFAEIDISGVLKRSETVFGTITETRVLLDRFRDFLARELGCEKIDYLFFREDTRALNTLPITDAAVEESLERELGRHASLYLGLQWRALASVLPDEVCRRLTAEEIHVILAVRDPKGQATGAVLISQRLSGRVFSSTEIEALESLAYQFSRAFNNAQLFTQVERSRDYVQNLIDSLPLGVMAIGRAGQIAFSNPEFVRLFGDRGRTLARQYRELPAPLPEVIDLCLAEDEEALGRDRVAEITHQGRPIRFAVRKMAYGDADEMLAISYSEDLTNVKSLEQQLIRADRLSKLGRLSASIAHEVKNPLTAIKTFTQLVPENLDNPEFLRGFAEIVGDEVRKIDTTVRQLLDFARGSESAIEEVDVNEAIENLSKLMQAELSSSGIVLRTELDAHPALVRADRQKLSQALLNIVLNAKEAEGSRKTSAVCVATSLPKRAAFSPHAAISEKISITDSFVCVTIEDDGPGFPPGAIESAFEPFFTTKTTGTGLGLAIVFGIVGELGGGIDIGNRPLGGAFVKLYLPATKQTPSTS